MIINSQQAKLVELLKELDDLGDPDAIAYYLAQQGIRGCGIGNSTCALATWLERKELFWDVMVHGDGMVLVYNRTTRTTVRTYAPSRVSMFIKLYDAGAYLWLRAS